MHKRPCLGRFSYYNSNTAKEVKRAIASDVSNCSGCHAQGHNLYFTDKVPADIPLYTAFRWSTPVEASLFAGEPATPAEYGWGQVVISDRRTEVTSSQVWDFYNVQLTSNGWTAKSGIPAAEAQFFIAEFEKSGRFVTVKCYNTATASQTGLVQSTGYRIEIWYK